MKIVYLAAGAAGMYCGSCLHDNTLAAALMNLGEDVILAPTYTPIRTDEDDVSRGQVLFGGINVYLQQKFAIFRHTPAFMERWLDSPRLLNMLSKLNFSVRAEALGAMTVSIMRGEQGNQRKELDKLVQWLVAEKPDVVHLSNAMLCGMAREIRRRVKVPVVCSLSGEDIFLEKLTPPFYQQARDALRERARDVTAFVALNQYYADYMVEYADIEPSKVHVIPHGLKLAGHGTRQRIPGVEAFTVGYFARICHDKGLHQLIAAAKILAEDKDLPRVRIRAAGYLHADDRDYLANVLKDVEASGLSTSFDYLGELDRNDKISFFQSIDALCVPTVYRESKGLSILEALANAVPVVLPAHGSFPEIVNDTQGGLLTTPHDPQDIARAIRQMMLDPPVAAEMGRRGQRAIHDRYTAERMAEQTKNLYHGLVDGTVT